LLHVCCTAIVNIAVKVKAHAKSFAVAADPFSFGIVFLSNELKL